MKEFSYFRGGARRGGDRHLRLGGESVSPLGSFWFVPFLEIWVKWLRGNDLIGEVVEGELFAEEG